MTAAIRHSFNSLEVPNYRRYFTGQLISLSGTWMQTVAAVWVVLSLTGSGVAVGLTTALQFLPMLLIGAWGGVLADRIPKRRLLIATQALMAIPALGLFAVTATGVVAPWMVFLAVFAMGSVNAVDNPTRQSFVIEMVGPNRVVNAVSLNSVIVQAARIVGPAFAGILIATVGVVPCFAINALTFGAMILALWRMDPARLHPPPPAKHQPGAIRAGLRYVRHTPELLVPLALMALVGTLGFNFQVVLPLLAKFSFQSGAMTYAALVSAMAVGSIVGALVNGHRGRTGLRRGRPPCRPDADPGLRGPSPDAPRRRLGHLRRHDQLHAPIGRSPRHARPGDGPLQRRLPGEHSHRRPPRGLAGADLRPAGRPPSRRCLRPRRRLGRSRQPCPIRTRSRLTSLIII
jgi:MFS family permease